MKFLEAKLNIWIALFLVVLGFSVLAGAKTKISNPTADAPSSDPEEASSSSVRKISQPVEAKRTGKTSRSNEPIGTPKSAVGAFRMQVGVGGNLIPTVALWNLRNSEFFYQGGLQATVFGRIHRYVTLEGSVGVTGNTFLFNRGLYSEFATNIGARVYVRSMDNDAFLDQFFLAPYVVGTFLLNLTGSGPIIDGGTVLYLGTQLGGGVEFRLNSQMVIHADLRVVIRDGITYTVDLPQLGFQLGTGFAYFF